MNQGKLEVVKQDMARVNFDILVISELKRTVMCEFNLNDHYIYYHGQVQRALHTGRLLLPAAVSPIRKHP